MPNKEYGGKLLKPVAVYPPDRPDKERVADYRIHMESGQRLEIDNRAKNFVVHEVVDGRPKQVLVISDWHLGSTSSDMDMMDELLLYVLSNPDVMVIFAGDEIEGWSGGKYSQSIDAKADLDAQQQIEFMRMMYFEPLAKAGRILGMVSEYWGHPGWLSEKTLNVWRTMIGDLDIKLIQNGGHLAIKYPNQKIEDAHVIKVWHNPPKGSRWDEVDGQRTVMQNTSESSRPDGSVAGHIHQMQVAQEVYAGAKRKVYYISAGTVKGINPKLSPDLFGTQLGLSGPGPQGEGVTIIPKKGRREEMNIPFANLRQAKMAIDAVGLLDRMEQLGIKDEWIQKIHSKVEDTPVISYPAGSNRLGQRFMEARPPKSLNIGGESIKNPYSHIEMKAPYSVLSMDIRTKLPVALELVANARIGSTMEGYKDLKKHAEDLANNPHRLVLFLRNMIDKESGKLPDRIDVLDKFVDLIGRPEEKINGQTIAIMMCESMRQDAWKKKVGKSPDHMPVAPASYVASHTGIPLIHHLSLLKFAIGPGAGRKTIYPVVAADKAENSGSGTKPVWGLQRLYDLYIHEKPGAVVGTHMPNAGAATIWDSSNAYTHYPSLISPGWWAGAVDSMGKGNVKTGAEPGQAIIFMPGAQQDDYLAFPTVSKEETEYMHDALMLLKGLEIMEKEKPGLKKRILGKI